MRGFINCLARRGAVLLVLLALLTDTTMAAGDTVYHINWAGIDLAFPTDYIVCTGTETTGRDSNDVAVTEDVYLYADWTDADGNMDFSIQVYDFGDCELEYAAATEAQLDAEFAMLDQFFREDYSVQQSCWVENAHTKFAFFSYVDDSGNYWKSYVTGHYQEYTILELVAYGKNITWEMADIMDAVIETVKPVSGGAATDTGAAVSTDPAPAAQVEMPLGTVQSSDPITPLETPQQVVIPGLTPVEADVPDYVADGNSATSSDSTDSSGKSSDAASTGNAIAIGTLVAVFGGIVALIVSAKNKKKKKAAKEPVYAASAAAYSEPVYTPPASSYTPPAASYTPAPTPPAPTPAYGGRETPAEPGSYRMKRPESPSGVKYCPGCGQQMKLDAAFCGKCGRKLN